MRFKEKRVGAAMQALRVGVIAMLLGATTAATVSLPGCPTTCGNISIPYPFGIGPGCFKEGFNLTCSNSSNPPKLFLGDGTVQVLSISLPDGTVHINSNKNLLSDKDIDMTENGDRLFWRGLMDDGPYTFSSTVNRFVALGCRVLAGIMCDDSYICFCGSMCRNDHANGVDVGACSGLSCCQTSISEGIKNFDVVLRYLSENPPTRAQRMLIKAFVVELNSYSFSPGDLKSSRDVWESRVIPAVLDWTIRDTGSCKNLTSFKCPGNNSECYDSADRDMQHPAQGYRCKCSKGFEGNPYISGGCEDIDECSAPHSYGCHGTCLNLPGTYRCFCPEGTYASSGAYANSTNAPSIHPNSTGPQRINECIPSSELLAVSGSAKSVEILTGVGIGTGVLLLLLLAITLLSRKLKARRTKKLKESYFRQNKGLLLQQLISSNQDAAERVKIFTSEELEKATNSFDRTRILGHGGHGTVYKGILLDLRVVAIKKSNINIQSEIDQFINEVVILTQINHRNVVKLFGCCLETKVPLLVYEFVSNGTLSQHLHADNGLSLSWDDRLRIATEITRALAYLHTAASLSVFHRDIKSANILLDDALTAKVSDFGASRYVPLDHTRITTMVQGTFGYLDPEYFHTSQLTDKSDVYSLGVILVELLTGQKAVSNSILPEGRNLATHFLFSLKDNCHSEILDARVVEEGGEVELESVANLAEMCLRLKGEERPTMKEVEARLEALRGSKKLPQYTMDAQKLEHLSGPSMPRKRSSVTTTSFSLQKESEVGKFSEIIR